MVYERPYAGAVDPDPAKFQQLVGSGELVCFSFVLGNGQDPLRAEAYVPKSHSNNLTDLHLQILKSFARMALTHTPPSLVRERIGEMVIDHEPGDVLSGADQAFVQG